MVDPTGEISKSMAETLCDWAKRLEKAKNPFAFDESDLTEYKE